MSLRFTRRQALATAAAGGAASVIGAVFDRTAIGQASSITARFVRHNAFSASGKAMLVSYAKAVKQMKAWSVANPNDLRGWVAQAAIHGSLTITGPLYNQCPHGSWWFLPWHRAYLWYFERIVRAASGDPNFTLPYWPWDCDHYLSLPPEFLNPSSPLYDTNRDSGVNSGSPITSQSQAVQQALTLPFLGGTATFGFGGNPYPSTSKGKLENPPHDAVHAEVEGDMGVVQTSAQDPIFWLHHSNIDRLWDEWLSRGNNNPVDPSWLKSLWPAVSNPQPGQFVDENGATQTVTTSDVIPPKGKLYDYRYDPLQCPQLAETMNAPSKKSGLRAAAETAQIQDQPAISEQRSTLFGKSKTLLLTGEEQARPVLGPDPVTVAMSIPVASRPKLEGALALGAAAKHNPPMIQLHLSDVRTSGPPGVIYRVYLNQPGATSATEPRDANFVGELALFVSMAAAGNEHAGHKHVNEYRFDITRLVRKLRSTDRWDPAKVSVTFVPKGVGGNRPKAEVTLGKMQIVAAQD